MKKWLIVLMSCIALTNVQADALSQLKSLMNDGKAFSATFEQTVTATKKNKKDKSSGEMLIMIPGKFRWNYTKPYNQLLLADGKTLWIYDKELAQVTKKTVNDAIGSSPAALLAGNIAIDKNYTIKEIGKRGDVEWLSATPKTDDTSFKNVLMGFKNNSLVEMEINDSFGNNTSIKFSNLKKNPKVNAKSFQFTPPKGVDIISDE